MKFWNNLSDAQKRMAKISALQTIVITALMIVKPVIKGENISIVDWLIFMLVLFAFNIVISIGIKYPPKGKS